MHLIGNNADENYSIDDFSGKFLSISIVTLMYSLCEIFYELLTDTLQLRVQN